MTSRRCFIKILHEDFRHKLWMLALSILGNLLAFPVTLLLSLELRGDSQSVRFLVREATALGRFFGNVALITGGVIAIAGALIVGLFGFRQVFHRNMTDAYHSLPVRRRTLFIAGWLNGFLIWFVPFLVSLCIALAYAVSRLGAIKGALVARSLSEEERLAVEVLDLITGGGLTADALVSILALLAAFLLAYHLALFAVALCGNLLNTLGVTGILGGGAIAIYGLFVWMQVEYFDTFATETITGVSKWGYASPLASAVVLLNKRALWLVRMSEAPDPAVVSAFWTAFVINLCIALALGLLAFLAYEKRSSELAEQGLKLRPLRFLVQVMAALAASMAGWMVFYSITSTLVWSIFGSLLAGCIVFGVMDIIFHMEFKSFFAHKALMAAVAAAGILIGLTYHHDWMGYDTYLPKEEEIAEISIYNYNYTNQMQYDGDILDASHPLNQVSICDSGAAYRFLTAAVEEVKYRKEPAAEAADANTSVYSGVFEGTYVRCKLKNGRTYYRYYQLSEASSEATLALLNSKEYLDAHYRLNEEPGSYVSLDLSRGNLSRNHQENEQLIEELCRAYNQDLEENPEAIIRGNQRLLCSVHLSAANRLSWQLEIYDSMQRTKEVLRRYGFAQFTDPVAAEDVEEIRLQIDYWDGAAGGPVERAAYTYGVELGGGVTGLQQGEPEAAGVVYGVTQTYAGNIEVRVTDKAEIRELLELISYDLGQGRVTTLGKSRVGMVRLTVAGETEPILVNVLEGTLPEKYILRFGEAAESR